jgi:amino acid efflux transporter
MSSALKPKPLSTIQGASLYVGALLGPSLLLLPGIAAAVAGPASIVSWLFMLVLSGLLAIVFAALGTRSRSEAGVAGYVADAFGPFAGRMTGWCFLAGVVTGAPVVCFIGGNYVAEFLGAGKTTALVVAGLLLLLVLAVTSVGVTASARLQLALVGVLLLLVLLAVLGSITSSHGENWAPFAPHGMWSIGQAAANLMLSFVGWEAVASLTSRLRDPRRQLPRVIGLAFGATSIIYIGVAATIIAVLGANAGGTVPIARLLAYSLHDSAPAVAAIGAVVVTLAATNAYVTGGTALASTLMKPRPAARPPRPSRRLLIPFAIVAAGMLLLGGSALNVVSLTTVVAIPTAFFLAVYVASTAAAARTFRGAVRLIAMVACFASTAVLLFAGWAITLPFAVVAIMAITHAISSHSRRLAASRNR